MTLKEIIKTVEKLGWRVIKNEDGTISIENWSPAGENLYYELTGKTGKKVSEEINDIYEDFDADEHLEMHVRARLDGIAGVPRIQTLCADVEAVEDMLAKLAWAVY